MSDEVLLPALQVQNLGCGKLRLTPAGCEPILFDVSQIFVTTTAMGLVYVDVRDATPALKRA